MAEWPWPQDTTQDRLRRIVDSYRTALREVDPATCNLVDARMVEYGQGWVCGDRMVDVDALMTIQEIASMFGFNPWDVKNWYVRNPEAIPKRGKQNGKLLFRVGDVLAYQVSQRQK